MRVLVLGGTGMLGHKLVQCLPLPFETFATVRTDPAQLSRFGFYRPDRVVCGVDAMNFSTVESAVRGTRPDAVVNCIGIIKQQPLAKDPVVSLTINSLLPHRLNELCTRVGARLVHVSTDCVFDGTTGSYKENDVPTAEDLYGRTKSLGEVTDCAVTLRTSIIGRELAGSSGLVEWFLSQNGTLVKGYTQARFSGVTTQELCRVIAKVLLEHKEMSGLWHVASEPIDKHALLNIIKDRFDHSTEIEPDNAVRVDRTLDGSAFRAATGYVAPDWPAMVARMATDPTPYDTWRN